MSQIPIWNKHTYGKVDNLPSVFCTIQSPKSLPWLLPSCRAWRWGRCEAWCLDERCPGCADVEHPEWLDAKSSGNQELCSYTWNINILKLHNRAKRHKKAWLSKVTFLLTYNFNFLYLWHHVAFILSIHITMFVHWYNHLPFYTHFYYINTG